MGSGRIEGGQEVPEVIGGRGESKEFFERLRKMAFKPYLEDEGYTAIERAGIIGVIDATIEVLRGMAVPKGEMIEAGKGYVAMIFRVEQGE